MRIFAGFGGVRESFHEHGDQATESKICKVVSSNFRLPEVEVLRAELKSKENVDKIVERLFLLSITSSENLTATSSNLETGGVKGDGTYTIYNCT